MMERTATKKNYWSSKFTLVFISFLFNYNASYSQIWMPSAVSNMPVAISNNAVCEAKINGQDYMYSFGGIDTTKNYQGINLEAYKYSITSDSWSIMPELPDTLGKIAAAASYVKGKIYIIGGYHVYSNGSEASSYKVHIFDPSTDTYLANGQDIPVPIDDQAQVVWRDSLIYVISGWSNNGNVADVQVYNPTDDTWSVATSVPNDDDHKVFGTQGVIKGDTIYYYGGANMDGNFPAQSLLRIGVIDDNNPLNINWLPQQAFASHPLYRMIGLSNPDGSITFLGGSKQSYNYNGLAYTNGQGVSPANEQVIYSPVDQIFSFNDNESFPMDLRGYADVSPTEKYICGGMETNQMVTTNAYKLTYMQSLSTAGWARELNLKVFPNPSNNQFTVQYNYAESLDYQIVDAFGRICLKGSLNEKEQHIDVALLQNGTYFLVLRNGLKQAAQSIAVHH